MLVRPFNVENDYSELKLWWEKQEWQALPPNCLTGTGFVAEEDGKMVAATWVFPTNCPIYIMEWTVGNPDVDWKVRGQGVVEVTNHACEWAKKDGASMIFTMTKSDRLIEKLTDNKFIETDRDMIHLMRSL